MTILRWQTHLGYSTETAGWGVINNTSASYYVPVTKCDFEDKPNFYYDTAYRSIQAEQFGAYLATLASNFSYTADAYVGTLPVILGNAMVGGPDQVSTVLYTSLGVGIVTGSVTAHTYTLGSPESLTHYFFSGYSERRIEGCRPDQVDIKYNPDKQVEVDVKGMGRLSVVNATGSAVAAPTIDSRQPVLAWEARASFAGVQTIRLIDANITFKRKTETLFTQAMTQSPTNIYAFPLEVDGKITVDFQDEAEYNFFRTNNQSQSFDLFFFQNPNGGTTSAAQEGFRITVPQPVYDTYKLNTGKDAITADITFKGVYNLPQATNVKVIFYNAITSAYA